MALPVTIDGLSLLTDLYLQENLLSMLPDTIGEGGERKEREGGGGRGKEEGGRRGIGEGEMREREKEGKSKERRKEGEEKGGSGRRGRTAVPATWLTSSPSQHGIVYHKWTKGNQKKEVGREGGRENGREGKGKGGKERGKREEEDHPHTLPLMITDPSFAGELSKLGILRLDNNRLTSLPDTIGG